MNHLNATVCNTYRTQGMDACRPMLSKLNFEQSEYVLKYIEVMSNEDKSKMDRYNKWL